MIPFGALSLSFRSEEKESASSFAFAVASEIGPGFSPDINRPQKNRGFSPWNMLSSPSHKDITEVPA
jgi:hypothetical protein